MAIAEEVLEEIFFHHPREFLPDRRFTQFARQLHLGAREHGARIDFAFRDDDSGEYWVFEAKALRKATLAVVEQVARYLEEARRLQYSSCECPFPRVPKAGVVAPDISSNVRAELERHGIAALEFPEDKFTAVAAKFGIPLLRPLAEGLQLRYWQGFSAHLGSAGSLIARERRGRGLKSFEPVGRNHVDVAIGITGAHLTFRCSVKDNSLDVDLTCGSKDANVFTKLCGVRRDVDAALGGVVLWFKQGSERHVRVQRWPSLQDESQWPSHYGWMREQGEVLLSHARAVR